MEWGEFGIRSLDFITTPISEDARITILEGSVRSSKTVTMIPKWILYIKEGPPGLLVMTGVTKDTVYDNVLRDLFDTVGKKNYSYNRQTGDLNIYGRNIKVVGAKDEGSEKFLRGKTLAGAYCDEITLMPERFFKQLLNRLSVQGAKLYGTTNPDSPYHYLYTEYITNEEKLNSGMVKVIHFSLEDNPNLSQEYINFIKSAYTGLWYQRMILGLWVLAEGVIYDMYDEKVHVVNELPPFERYVVGIDYGTNNPCVFLLIGETRQKDLYLVKEYYYSGRKNMKQKTDLEYAQDFKVFLNGINPSAIYVDPSAASFITQLRKDGWGIKEAKNDVLDGIRFTAQLLSEKRVKIYQECKNVQQEFASYIWDEKACAKGEDKPLKDNDHAMDALRYVLFTHYSRPQVTMRWI